MNRETSRRQFLQFGNAAIFASLLAGNSSGGTMEIREAKDAVDHLVLAVNDLQRGIEWFEQKTGVRAVIGGRHPNRGTQNALVSLIFGGSRQYLEIMAPDPQQAGHERAAEDASQRNWSGVAVLEPTLRPTADAEVFLGAHPHCLVR